MIAIHEIMFIQLSARKKFNKAYLGETKKNAKI